MIKKIGKFETTDNVLRVTDPCYDKDTWCCGTIKNCEVGEWTAFLIYSDEGQWGNRVAENIAVFGDVSIEELKILLDEGDWKTEDIDVGVDSGQAGIFQDSKYPDGETGEYGDDNSFYGKVCNITLSNDQGGVLDFGVVSSSGYGDGSYECLSLSNNFGKVYAIKIVFIEDEFEEDEEF